MNSKIKGTAAAVIVAGAMSFGFAGSASAAHCNDTGAPGNSDYAGHVRAANGPAAHNEGDHRGSSSCNENSRNYAS